MFQPNGISLHVEDHGSGKAVVLLHGCSPLSPCWKRRTNYQQNLKRKADQNANLCHSTDATEFMTQLIAEAETVFSKCWDAVTVLRETRDEDEA